MKKTMGTITIGLGLAALLAGCGEPKYSRVWVVNSALSGKSMGVEERGMTREACELSVLNAGRTSSAGGMLTTGTVCVTDVRALELEQEDKAKKLATAETAAKASAPKAQPKEEVPDAAAAQKRTDDLLKRTENLVVAPQGKGYPKTRLTVGTGYTTSNNREVIVDERDVFVRGEKFAFVLEYGRAIYAPVELTAVEDQTQRVAFRVFLSADPGGTTAHSGSLRDPVDLANGHYRLLARGGTGSEILASARFSVQDRGVTRTR